MSRILQCFLVLSGLSIVETSSAAAHIDAGVAYADNGRGPRPTVSAGYTTESGWDLSLSYQKLAVLRSNITARLISGAIVFGTHSAESESTALYFGHRWNLTPEGKLTFSASIGAHYWKLQRFEAERIISDSRDRYSGFDPMVRVEVERRISPPLAIGVSRERFRESSLDVSRTSLFLRYYFGAG